MELQPLDTREAPQALFLDMEAPSLHSTPAPDPEPRGSQWEPTGRKLPRGPHLKDDGSRTQAGGTEQRQHVRERIVERWADHPRRQLLLDAPLTGGSRTNAALSRKGQCPNPQDIETAGRAGVQGMQIVVSESLRAWVK